MVSGCHKLRLRLNSKPFDQPSALGQPPQKTSFHAGSISKRARMGFRVAAFYAVAALFGFIYAGTMPLYSVLARENFPLQMIRTDLKVVRLPSRICRLSAAAMDALLALVRDRPAAFTTQPISREFDEAGVKRDRRWLEELREREHVRNRPTRLLRPIRLRRIADGNEECRDLIIAETKLT